MNNNYFKVLVFSLLLTCLLGAMACATGGGGQPVAPSAPGGNYPTPSDPEFWKLWESSHGLG